MLEYLREVYYGENANLREMCKMYTIENVLEKMEIY